MCPQPRARPTAPLPLSPLPAPRPAAGAPRRSAPTGAARRAAPRGTGAGGGGERSCTANGAGRALGSQEGGCEGRPAIRCNRGRRAITRAGAATARTVLANALPTVRDPMQPITPARLREEATASAARRRRRKGEGRSERSRSLQRETPGWPSRDRRGVMVRYDRGVPGGAT